MEGMKSLPGSLPILLAFVALASPARADDGDRFFRTGASATLEPLALVGQTTSACEKDEGCGSTIIEYGVTGILRLRPVELGFVLQEGGEVWGTHHLVIGAVGGVAFDPLGWMRVEALAELGVHSMDDIGSGLFVSASEPFDAAFPYAGLRLGWTARFGSGPVRPLVGVWTTLQADLGDRDTEVQERTCFIFGCSTSPAEYDLGGITAAVAVRAGIELR